MVTHLHDVPTNILDKHTDMTPFYSVITTSKRATSICTLRHGHSCLSQALCCSLWYKCLTRFKVKGGGVETGPFERLQSSSLQWGELSFIFTFLSLSPFSLILSSFYFIYFSHTLKKIKIKIKRTLPCSDVCSPAMCLVILLPRLIPVPNSSTPVLSGVRELT